MSKLIRCNVALTTIHDSKNSGRYFDSGHLHHMTDYVALFYDLQECHSGQVMFGNGASGKMFGKGSIDKPGLPCLSDVRLVKGLSTNLISVSQLCDQGFPIF